ncbi:MAG TPA: dihydroneopterin aldolase [Atribacteraceae bacterium]|nr:dihydroneopterin aldolase [Atribacteraceae bacterium]
MNAVVKITNLRLRTIIGAYEWERVVRQDVVINITLEYNALRAIESDNLNEALDYKTLTKKIIEEVENSRFHLLESLAARVHSIVAGMPGFLRANVRVDKPGALRYADSVAVEISDG